MSVRILAKVKKLVSTQLKKAMGPYGIGAGTSIRKMSISFVVVNSAQICVQVNRMVRFLL